MKRRLFAAVATLALVACKQTPNVSVPDAPPPAQVQPSAVTVEDSLSTARALAFAPSRGSSVLDTEITELQRLSRDNPRKVDYVILLGRAWVRKARQSSDPGFYVNANACAEIVLADLAPGDLLALDLRVLVLLNDHKFAEARELASEIVQKYPESPMAWGSLSDALLELGRFEQAAEAAQKMVDLKPNLPSYSRASYLRWLQGDDKAALEFSRLALDAGRDPKDKEPRAWQLVQTALIFWHRGDYEGADAGFERALDAVSEFPPALVGRGRIALANGDPRRAAELFGRAFHESPLVETAWLLGDARELAGDLRGAADAYAYVEKEGKKSDPRTLSLYYSTKNKEPQLALELAREERKVRGDVATLDALAWALYRNGNIQEARTVIDEARRLGTNDARLLYHQGAIHIAAGDVAMGRRLVGEAFARNPKFDVTLKVELESAALAGAVR